MGIVASKFVDIPSTSNGPCLKAYLSDSPVAVVKDVSDETSNDGLGKRSFEASERFGRATDELHEPDKMKQTSMIRLESSCREICDEGGVSIDVDCDSNDALGSSARQMSSPSKLKVENWLSSNFDDDDNVSGDGNECEESEDDDVSSQNALQELVRSHVRGFEMLVGDVEDEQIMNPAGMFRTRF